MSNATILNEVELSSSIFMSLIIEISGTSLTAVTFNTNDLESVDEPSLAITEILISP